MSSTVESTSVVQSVLRRVTASEEYVRLAREIKDGARIVSISGLTGGPPARALALAALQREAGKCFALVTQANRDLEAWERDVRFWYCALRGRTECDDTVWTLPSSQSDPYAGASPHPDTLQQ